MKWVHTICTLSWHVCLTCPCKHAIMCLNQAYANSIGLFLAQFWYIMVCLHGYFQAMLYKVGGTYNMYPHIISLWPYMAHTNSYKNIIHHSMNAWPSIHIHFRLRCCLWPILWGWHDRLFEFDEVGAEWWLGANLTFSQHILWLSEFNVLPYQCWGQSILIEN